MTEAEKLIPLPPVVRDRLARNIKERRLLRSLLRLSVRAAEDRREHGPTPPRTDAERPGGAE